jgi:hypothetical protein
MKSEWSLETVQSASFPISVIIWHSSYLQLKLKNCQRRLNAHGHSTYSNNPSNTESDVRTTTSLSQKGRHYSLSNESRDKANNKAEDGVVRFQIAKDEKA